MSGKTNEKLSSLMDDYVDSQAIDQLLGDKDTKATWSRYHLARNIIHEETLPAIDLNLSARISEALEQEPAILAPPKTEVEEKPIKQEKVTASISWLKQIGGLAIAASVTAFTVLVYPLLSGENTNVNDVASHAPAVPIVSDNPPLLTTSSVLKASGSGQTQRSYIFETKEDKRLNQLLWQHAESAAEEGVQGFMPYVKVITYPVKPKEETKRK